MTSWRRSRLSSGKDEQRYGSFRTKELILDVYDVMAQAIAKRLCPTRRSSTRRPAMAPVTPPQTGHTYGLETTVADQTGVQRALLVQTTLEVLRDTGGPLFQPREAPVVIGTPVPVVQFTRIRALERPPPTGSHRWGRDAL